MLVLAILERAAAGAPDDALAYLEASWRLNRSLRGEPMVMAQLIAIAVARMQVGALRRVPDAPETWIERLGEHDDRASIMTALGLEGWIWKELALGRVARLELDTEMTSSILRIPAHQRRTGDLPDALPSAASTTCPSARWRCAREDGGRVVLELDRTLAWGSRLGVMLPLRYEG